MKRILILLAIVLFSVGTLFAEEGVLIDFSLLTADSDDDIPQNSATVMDYGMVAGGSFTEEQKAVMKTSLAIANWEVLLASSSRFVDNMVRSYTLEAPSKQYGTVMGVRIHFPVEPFNSWAFIKPPFEIPAFESPTEGGGAEDGIITPSKFEAREEGGPAYGVIKNVGTIKALQVRAYGLNFPHGLFLTTIDSRGVAKEVFMGYLSFDGWSNLEWKNPAYVTEVRNRELRLVPLYPANTPFIKFGGFRVARDAAKEGGDFVGYFKEVRVIYDKAVVDTERDIDDESLWGIIRDRETSRKVWEMERFGNNQVLRYLDTQKKAPEELWSERKEDEQN